MVERDLLDEVALGEVIKGEDEGVCAGKYSRGGTDIPYHVTGQGQAERAGTAGEARLRRRA